MKNLVFMLAAILFLGLTACETGFGKKSTAQKVVTPPDVTVCEAVHGDIYRSMVYVAQTRSYDSVDLTARVEGYLTKKHFVEGQYVKKGDLLFEIEDVNYKAALAIAEGNLMRIQAELENAKSDFSRQERLVKQNATAQQAYDRALYQMKEKEANFKAQEGEVILASQKLKYTKIYAPFDGQIGLAAYSVGNLVNPESRPLATLKNISRMRVQFNLSEVDLLNALVNTRTAKPHTDSQIQQDLKESLRVKLIFQNGSVYPFDGIVSFFDNQVNRTTGTMVLEAVFDNPGHVLMPGMYVKVKLEEIKPLHALLIPQRAITQTQAGDQVITVDSANVTDIKIIKTGIKFQTAVQVLGGLNVGERVITEGLLKASRRGVTVRPVLDRTPVVKLSDSCPEQH